VLFAASASVMVAAIAIGLAYDETGGAPGRLAEPVARIAAVALDKPPERASCEGIDPAEVDFDRLCRVNDLPIAPSFIVWGDSHAMVAMPAVRNASLAVGRNGLAATSNGCVPLIGVWRPVRDAERECAAFNAAVLDTIRAHTGLTTVIMHARWARHAEGTVFGDASGEVLYLADETGAGHDDTPNHRIFAAALDRTIEALALLGREVVVIGPVPEIGRDVPNVLAKARWHDRPVDLDLPLAAFESRQAFVLASLARLPATGKVALQPVHSLWCDDQRCAATAAGMPLYFDDNHLASAGARRLEPLFQRLLASAHGDR
jgi:hypothetical protein